MPTVGASTYTTLPVATLASSFLSVPVDPLPVPADSRVAVCPDLTVYTLASPGEVSPTVTVSAPDGNNEVTVTFEHAGSGLMVAGKTGLEKPKEEQTRSINYFELAGADGKWFPAQARIAGKTVQVLNIMFIASPY